MKNNSLYDIEYFQKIKNEQKASKIRKRKIKLVLVIVVLLVLIYLVTPLSKINKIDISGNTRFTTQEVMKKAGIKKGQFVFMHPGFSIKRNLENTDVFMDIDVKKSITGNVSIKVKEARLLFYTEEKGKTYFYDEKGNKIILDKKRSQLYQGMVASLDGNINEKLKKKLIENLSQMSSSVLNEMSEIVYKPKHYDKEIFRFIMVGKKKIYIDASLDNLQNVDKSYHTFSVNAKYNCNLIQYIGSENKALLKKCKK
ncbi:MAG: FtsQ-type POTRA domain-containing protein [Erysipelotrichales bacterium]